MEVLASHTNNLFEKAHQSGIGKIVLSDAVINRGALIDGDSVSSPSADFIEMNITYSESKVMFDELCEVSWFETM